MHMSICCMPIHCARLIGDVEQWKYNNDESSGTQGALMMTDEQRSDEQIEVIVVMKWAIIFPTDDAIVEHMLLL